MVDRYKPVADVVVATVSAYNAAHPEGEYVKWKDYDAISARCAERQGVILQLEAQVKSLQRELLLIEACHHPGYVIGDHWLAWAYRRICMGEGEEAVMQDYGYTYTDPRPAARKSLDELAALDQELLGQPATPDGDA